MEFTPMSAEDAVAQAGGLWPDGLYAFEVHEATEKDSATGNAMIELQLKIYDASGGHRRIWDYLVATEKTAWKIRQFAASCGLLDQYNSGILMANEMVGRLGECEIGTRPAKDGYSAKNVVRNYLPEQAPAPANSGAAVPAAKRQPSTTPVIIDDSVPF